MTHYTADTTTSATQMHGVAGQPSLPGLVGQPGQPGATTLVEGHEMTNIDDGNDVGYGQASFDQGTAPQASVMTEQTQEGTKVIPAASNPFKKDPKSSSNPFNQ